jgi:hypothetical protein
MSRGKTSPFEVPQPVQSEGGYGAQYVPRRAKPDIPVRQPTGPGVSDIESQPQKYTALALIHLRNEMARLAVQIEDRSRPVNEYQPQEIVGELETTITVQPQWETTERITSIILTGPAGPVTLQLGDRIWPLTIPATGIIVISPISIFLGRNDTRTLTAATPGQYGLELSGYCDSRSQLI